MMFVFPLSGAADKWWDRRLACLFGKTVQANLLFLP